MMSLQTIVITLNNVQVKFNFVIVYALYYKTVLLCHRLGEYFIYHLNIVYLFYKLIDLNEIHFNMFGKIIV